MFSEGKIQTILASSFDKEPVDDRLTEVGFEVDEPAFDIIIDDGLHTEEANIGTFFTFEPYLKSGGVYIIEDIDYDDVAYDSDESYAAIERVMQIIRDHGDFEVELHEPKGFHPLIVAHKN